MEILPNKLRYKVFGANSRPSMKVRTSPQLAYVCALLLIFITGCGLVDTLRGINRSIEEATKVIEQGIEDIGGSSTMWADIVQQIARDLPDGISEIAREEAQNLATRSIAQVGTEFRCNADFLGRRAEQGLRRLLRIIKEENPSELPPVFCQVAPAAVDL